MRRARPAMAVAAACAVGAACSGPPPRPAERDPARIDARAISALPADPRLAGLYNTSCRGCHGRPGGGAPLALDRAAWDPRWARGLPALMQSVIGGRGGMPAGGQCFACSADDYRALVRFMADRSDK